jgi:DNA-binding transcriptional MerR regulator/methylmalonyl-CoA mutase cobalamin-binding subunit
MDGDEPVYGIGALARLTGLPQPLIRTWERRYAALQPARTGTNRRRYTASDMLRLRLLRAAVEAGNAIGTIAALSDEQLGRLAGTEPASPPRRPPARLDPARLLDRSVEAVLGLRPAELDAALAEAATDLGPLAFAEMVAAPLLQRVGDDWHAGRLHPAQEHLATEGLRMHLLRLLAACQPDGVAPVAVVATPRGQVHEMGALVAALSAACAGWSVIYLGAALPSDEIAWAARASGAGAILLSIVYPPDDPRLGPEIAALRRAVGSAVPILVGGRAAPAHAAALSANACDLCDNLDAMRAGLDGIRLTAGPWGAVDAGVQPSPSARVDS